MPARDRTRPTRRRLAYETARIMVEQDLCDYDRARRKAAERTGILDRRCWPSNDEIHEAVLAQRRLFLGDAHDRGLRRLRRAAAQAMEALDAFDPRLVGGALDGSGPPERGVQLQLYADCPEEVAFALIDRRIPWDDGERTLRYSCGTRRSHPVFRFVAGEIPHELIVLPRQALRNPPLDPVTERPERGADRAELERLLDAESDPAPPALAR